MPALTSFSPKPEPLVGPTGREALLCIGSAGLYDSINPSRRSARNRRPHAQLFRRHGDVAGALDRFVQGLGVADHLVLLPVWRRTWVSAGYAKGKLRPCSPVISCLGIPTNGRAHPLGCLNGRSPAVEK